MIKVLSRRAVTSFLGVLLFPYCLTLNSLILLNIFNIFRWEYIFMFSSFFFDFLGGQILQSYHFRAKQKTWNLISSVSWFDPFSWNPLWSAALRDWPLVLFWPGCQPSWERSEIKVVWDYHGPHKRSTRRWERGSEKEK